MLSSLVSGSSPATTGVLASSRKGTALLTAVRCHGRRMPRQGKPPILPPAKKVLYHVVHVPWQKPEYVKEMLWRRHVYLNAITSMRQIFEDELKAKEGDRQGVDAMKVEEQDEFEQLLQKNEQRNKKLAQTRAIRDKEEWTELRKEILEEIDSHLTKERQLAEKATEEVRQAIERSASFVDKSNLEARIKEALEKPIVYDFAIDKIGRKISNPAPVKYNEGTPTRQKGRLYDSTLGAGMQTDVDAVRQLSQQMVIKELAGQRNWLRVYPHLQSVSKALYYSATLLSGVQTLGEEYVHLIESDGLSRRLPSWASRFLFVALHVGAPILSQIGLQKAESRLSHPSTNFFLGIELRHNPKARQSFLSLIEWIRFTGIPQLHRLHVAVFYIFGAYYNLSRRTAGIRLISFSAQSNLQAKPTLPSVVQVLDLSRKTKPLGNSLWTSVLLGLHTGALSEFVLLLRLRLSSLSAMPIRLRAASNRSPLQPIIRQLSSKSDKAPLCGSPVSYVQRVNFPPIYFSGIQPTGTPHIGNYLGFIRPWVQLQQTLPKDTRMILSVVDQHAISTGPKNREQFRCDIRRMISSLLACGVDPKRCLLFRQSDLPEIAQLTWILSSLQTIAKLNRLPQFKEKASKYSNNAVPLGLLIYPVLQAADVFIFRATHVPVGEDQSQHMNILSDLALSFNINYGQEYFPQPKQVTTEIYGRIKSLRDPTKKMSKSDPTAKSRIELSDTKEEILEKCMKGLTDNLGPITYDPVNRPGVANLTDLLGAISSVKPSDVEGWKTTQLKEKLAEEFERMVGPIRERLNEIEQGDEVDRILKENAELAREEAVRNMTEIKKIVGFI
ncbi:hypothetical protein WR25_06119 [Diploscapter pachys]|uniref:tryptophan--tRNA ligase n=1 Tax=Diploscapter pachys TaxID=2018661 RepID=A0A2A2LDA1_9BILA|nr:hypothetical protein WR25_06119 [Diploscapter pachys]